MLLHWKSQLVSQSLSHIHSLHMKVMKMLKWLPTHPVVRSQLEGLGQMMSLMLQQMMQLNLCMT